MLKIVHKPNKMLLAEQRVVRPAAGYPIRPEPEASEPRLNISVVFTSVESTLAAMKKAGALASSLGARIALLVPQVVPYPLPLDNPPIAREWNENRFEELAIESPVETTV